MVMLKRGNYNKQPQRMLSSMWFDIVWDPLEASFYMIFNTTLKVRRESGNSWDQNEK